jgi:hypothetical protein
MREMFIEMGLNLLDLVPILDMFYGVSPRQSSTPIERIYLVVSYGAGNNKCKQMLIFEVASFEIVYNCILRRPFLLKFRAVIHSAYATMMMPGPKGVIMITTDHLDALACENATLT